MITIKMKNEQVIKVNHWEYFVNNVINRRDEYILNFSNNDIIKFIQKYFSDENLKLLCYGDIESINLYINKINDDYQSLKAEYLINKHIYKKIIKRINKYSRLIEDTNVKGNEKKLYNKWKNMLEYISKINNSVNIRNFKSEQSLFSNKSNITKLITSLKEVIKNETLREIIKYIFNYNTFRDKSNWNRHILFSMSGVEVCPYCNRQFISSYDYFDEEKTSADLDHFYSQKHFPYLALSLYNFIPSCQICNSRFKHSENFYEKRHLYPYEENIEKRIRFETDFYDQIDIMYLFGISDKFNIEVKYDKNDVKTCNSVETFRLKELYATHKDYVQEIIKTAYVYNETRILELYESTGLFKNEEEIKRLVFGNYTEIDDLSKRPLAKLTRDICEEFGIDKL